MGLNVRTNGLNSRGKPAVSPKSGSPTSDTGKNQIQGEFKTYGQAHRVKTSTTLHIIHYEDISWNMHVLKMRKIQIYLAMFLTVLPISVTASPILSLTHNRNVARVKKDELSVVVSETYFANDKILCNPYIFGQSWKCYYISAGFWVTLFVSL